MNAKQVVYRYNGDPTSEEVEMDVDGNVPVPNRDTFLLRKGKRWKVVHVTEESVLSKGAVPVLRIFLTDRL